MPTKKATTSFFPPMGIQRLRGFLLDDCFMVRQAMSWLSWDMIRHGFVYREAVLKSNHKTTKQQFSVNPTASRLACNVRIAECRSTRIADHQNRGYPKLGTTSGASGHQFFFTFMGPDGKPGPDSDAESGLAVVAAIDQGVYKGQALFDSMEKEYLILIGSVIAF